MADTTNAPTIDQLAALLRATAQTLAAESEALVVFTLGNRMSRG